MHYLGIERLDGVRIDPRVELELENLDIKKDERYLNSKAHYDSLQEVHSSISEEELIANQRYFYLKYFEEAQDFGLCISTAFARNNLLGFYAGVITDAPQDFYMNYPSQSGKPLFFEFSERSNMFPYILGGEEPNVMIRMVPFDNFWRVAVISIKDIQEGGQIICQSQGKSKNLFRIKSIDLFNQLIQKKRVAQPSLQI